MIGVVNEIKRKLKIVTGSCTRLQKEIVCYQKEFEEQKLKIQQMREENRDPYDIRKQEEVLGEFKATIPQCVQRLQNSLGDLESQLALAVSNSTEGEGEKGILSSDEYKNAKTKFEESQNFLNNLNLEGLE
eukprot:TRINITY_DN1426_c0_g2_i1.p1 TRINITY_DN1426_c0_g2~~TRINITY_DN1426_c0_g2_i1.p1  ORF type:complete len:131 (+),score=43.65 TRINITY_DN1426_c0_g2_i1:97-489(+)